MRSESIGRQGHATRRPPKRTGRAPSPEGEAARPASSVVVRILGRDDAAVLRRVADGVFDHPVDPALTEEFLCDPRHHLAVALSADLVVGIASAVHYVHPDKPAELWVNEVGVAPRFRRQGLGKRLLQSLLAHGKASGCSEAWLGTERSNAAARRLYAAVGGKEETMVYVTFPLDREPPS